MHQKRKHRIALSIITLVFAVAAISLRRSPSTDAWAPLFDIATLLCFVGLSFSLEPTTKTQHLL